jgi:hypothetical protein
VSNYWEALLVVFGLVALGYVFLLMTRRGMRRGPAAASAEKGASTARSRDEQFAEELRILWDKTTTTETLRAGEAAQASPVEEKR